MNIENGGNMMHQDQASEQGGSKCFDDDGRLKRTGNRLTDDIESLFCTSARLACVYN